MGPDCQRRSLWCQDPHGVRSLDCIRLIGRSAVPGSDWHGTPNHSTVSIRWKFKKKQQAIRCANWFKKPNNTNSMFCQVLQVLLKTEQSWQNISTLAEPVTSAYIKALKLNFNKQNQGQDFSWEYKHTSGIHTRSHAHILATLTYPLFIIRVSVSYVMEAIWFSTYPSHGDWVIQTHHLPTGSYLFVQYVTRSLTTSW